MYKELYKHSGYLSRFLVLLAGLPAALVDVLMLKLRVDDAVLLS
jgi:hypothetical protein